MEENELKDYTLIMNSKYEQLIEMKTKYEQYKNYILNNTQNNNLVKAMVAIEGKNLFELLDEKRKAGKNNE